MYLGYYVFGMWVSGTASSIQQVNLDFCNVSYLLSQLHMSLQNFFLIKIVFAFWMPDFVLSTQ